MLSGENGIITQAQDARDESKKAEIEEQVKLAVMAAKTEGLGSIDLDTLNSELDKIGYTGEEITTLPKEIEIDGVKVTIEDDERTETAGIQWGKNYTMTTNGIKVVCNFYEDGNFKLYEDGVLSDGGTALKYETNEDGTTTIFLLSGSVGSYVNWGYVTADGKQAVLNGYTYTLEESGSE